MKKFKKKLFEKYKLLDKNIVIIVLVGIVILSPLLNGQYMKGHDTYYHLANIQALSDSIHIHNGEIFFNKIVPMVMNNLGWGNGIFYPSLPHYITVYIYKILSIIDVSLLSTMNLVHALVLIMSGIFMYIFMKKISNNKLVSLLSSIFYMTFPYFFVDIGIRDAYAETFLFMFVPLVFLSLEYLADSKYTKFYILFILGYAGAINSHLVLSIYLTFFVVIYLIINYKLFFKKDKIIKLFIASLVILGLSAPFILPLIEHTIKANYAVYMKDMMFKANYVQNSTIGVGNYLIPATLKGYVTSNISIISLICFILVIINKKKIFINKHIRPYIILSFIAFIIMLPIVPWKIFPKFLLNIQFVWRIELFLAFFISIISGYILYLFSKVHQKNVTILLSCLAIFSVFPFYNLTYIQHVDLSKVDLSKSGSAGYQYLTEKGYKKHDELFNRKKLFDVLKGKATIKNIKNNTPSLSFDITTDGATIEIPRIYYLGYDVRIDDKKIEYKESKNGLIKIRIPHSGNVQIKYTGTFINKISLTLFIISLATIIIYFIEKLIKNYKLKTS